MTAPATWRYGRWMVRDYFLWGGAATVVLLVAVGAFLAQGALMMAQVRGTMIEGKLPLRALQGIATNCMVTLAVLGPMIATLDIVSRDRRFGYYRFLFSRPTSPAGYYARTFAINGAGFMAVCAILWVIFALFLGPLPIGGYLAVMALSYLFIGGMVFLLSTLARYDLLLFILVYILASVTWDTLGDPDVKGWVTIARPVLHAAPPVKQHLEMIYGLLRDGYTQSAWKVVWVLGYAVSLIGAGIFVLRKRSLGGA